VTDVAKGGGEVDYGFGLGSGGGFVFVGLNEVEELVVCFETC
jgi:hypothetical protein